MPVAEIRKSDHKSFSQVGEEKRIGKRWIAETELSSIKRTYGEHVSVTWFQHMVKGWL